MFIICCGYYDKFRFGLGFCSVSKENGILQFPFCFRLARNTVQLLPQHILIRLKRGKYIYYGSVRAVQHGRPVHWGLLLWVRGLVILVSYPCKTELSWLAKQFFFGKMVSYSWLHAFSLLCFWLFSVLVACLISCIRHLDSFFSQVNIYVGWLCAH